jgi:hypothetical protein
MRRLGPQLFIFLFVLAAAITLACGSHTTPISQACSSTPSATNSEIPQSVTVCPAVADAKNYPDGQIQFAAIGAFDMGPSPALPKPVLWGVCQQNQPTAGITVSTNGVAQCTPGASGTYTVWATGGPIVCNVVSPCGACGPTGSAQMTCP